MANPALKPSIRSLAVLLLFIGITVGVWCIYLAQNDIDTTRRKTEQEPATIHEQEKDRQTEDTAAVRPGQMLTMRPREEPILDKQEQEEEYIQVKDPVTDLNDFQSGVAILMYSRDYMNTKDMEWKLDLLFDRLIENNVNSISLTFPIFQDDVSSVMLYTDKETPEKNELAYFIEKARERGFFITFRPIIDEGNFTGNDWRGTIRPRDHDAWFESYTSLIVEYAELAEKEDVDIFSIGVELTSMEKHSSYWEEVIKEVREVYSGYLTYASNSGVSQSMPWDKLDLISVDAFFRLDAPNDNATKKDIVSAWQHWVKEVENDARLIDKPIVFAELGAASQQGSYTHSWRWDHNTPVDMRSQRLYYDASCSAWKDTLNGIYWWAINIWLHEEPENDPGFNPIGKPAEQEIAKCFS